MPGNHGGHRPGSGRKPHPEKYEAPISSATDRLAANLGDITEALIDVALGRGFEEKWLPAGLVTKKDVLRDPPDENHPDGQPWLDDKGKPVVVDVQVFPDLAPNELVLVEQKPWKPDVKAIAEVWDRLNGKARQALELNNGEDGPLKIEVVYVNGDPPGRAADPARGPGEDPPGAEAI